jgi:hypothetical protein
MEPSEEIRRVIDRWLQAVTTGDADTGPERLSETRAVWARQLEERGAMPVT